jgi:hypothetical protein
VLGVEVASLLDGEMSAGEHTQSITHNLPEGSYLLALRLGTRYCTHSILVAK